MGDDVNLRQLKPSRKIPKVGDIFAMLMPDGRYLYGRVILANLPSELAPMPTSNLVYIYDIRTKARTPAPLDALSPDRLLLPPQFINRLPWSKGYFENVAHQPIRESDLLAQHCFWDVVGKVYCDETGHALSTRTEPCGVFALGSYRMIDDLVSDALGIPRAPL